MFAVKNEGYSWIDIFSHHSDTDNACTLLLMKQGELYDMVKDMKGQVESAEFLGVHPSCSSGRTTDTFSSVWTMDG
jgi:hypothetical protein